MHEFEESHMKNVRLVKNQYSIKTGSVHGLKDRYSSCNGKSNLLLRLSNLMPNCIKIISGTMLLETVLENHLYHKNTAKINGINVQY